MDTVDWIVLTVAVPIGLALDLRQLLDPQGRGGDAATVQRPTMTIAYPAIVVATLIR